jgi:GntR family transcriptional regulator
VKNMRVDWSSEVNMIAFQTGRDREKTRMQNPHMGTAEAISLPGRDVVPLYHRVYVILSQKISDGSYPPGEAMPSEDDLAESFGVSRVTIRKAMERLEREERILRQRGRGTFPQPQALKAAAKNQLLNNQISLSRKTQISVLDYALVPLPQQLAEAFGQAAGSEILRIVRVRKDERSPISHTICYVVTALAPLLPPSAITSLPISATLAAAGVELARFEERITATLADSEVARHLDIDVGTALIRMTRKVRNREGRVLELLQALYRPDRYEYRVEYSAEDQNSETPLKAMITDSGA